VEDWSVHASFDALDLAVELFDCVVVPPLEPRLRICTGTFALIGRNCSDLAKRVCILDRCGPTDRRPATGPRSGR